MLKADVRVHLPLKQGLRRPVGHQIVGPDEVRVHLPLKQGLRQPLDIPNWCRNFCTSASSIKTRIKTPAEGPFSRYGWHGTSASSIKTRIKT